MRMESPREPERQKSREQLSRGEVPVGAILVASGKAREHAGKRIVGSVPEVVAALEKRAPEDLQPHHEAVAAFSTTQRNTYWEQKTAENPQLATNEARLAAWQQDVFDSLHALGAENMPAAQFVAQDVLGITADMPTVADFDATRSAVIGGIENFRQKYLAGPARVDAFAKDFTQGKSAAEVQQDLALMEPFLGVFGGAETVALVKDSVLAHAYLQDMQDAERKQQLLTSANTVLSADIPEETAALYGKLYKEPVDLRAGEEVTPEVVQNGELVEPAPLRRGEGTAAAETEKESVLSYADFQKLVMEHELGKFPELQEWFAKEAATFPEMRVETDGVSMTNGKDWTAEFIKNQETQEVEGVTSINNARKFFALKGLRVLLDGKVSHTQPGLFEDTADVEIETAYGRVRLKTSGFVGVIRDTHGNVLVGLGQEPLSDTPNHIVVKDPLQTSIGKFLMLMGDPEHGVPGDPTKDKAFSETLGLVFPGADPFQSLLTHLEKPDTIWAMGAVNGNRLNSSNISFEMVIPDDQKDALIAGGKNRWVDEDERKALQRAGLLNLIGTGAFTAV